MLAAAIFLFLTFDLPDAINRAAPEIYLRP